jgi:hypothetical protein
MDTPKQLWQMRISRIMAVMLLLYSEFVYSTFPFAVLVDSDALHVTKDHQFGVFGWRNAAWVENRGQRETYTPAVRLLLVNELVINKGGSVELRRGCLEVRSRSNNPVDQHTTATPVSGWIILPVSLSIGVPDVPTWPATESCTHTAECSPTTVESTQIYSYAYRVIRLL